MHTFRVEANSNSRFFQFRDVATQRYLTSESISAYLSGIMSDYFMGTWANGKPKPFK